MYAPSSTAATHPLTDANTLVTALEASLSNWASAVANLTAMTADMHYTGLPILGRMGTDRPAALDTYTEAERVTANSVIYQLNELVEFAVSNPSYVKLIRAHVDVLTLSARWSGKAFVTLYGYRRRSIGPVNRIRKGVRPVPVASHSNDQCYGVQCDECGTCDGCGLHAPACSRSAFNNGSR